MEKEVGGLRPRHYQLAQDLPNRLRALGSPVTREPLQVRDQLERLIPELRYGLLAILKGALAGEVVDGEALDVVVGRLLFEDVDESEVRGVGADAVDDGE